MTTRSSTPKYLIVTVWDQAPIFGPASKTACKDAMRGMNARRITVKIVPFREGLAA